MASRQIPGVERRGRWVRIGAEVRLGPAELELLSAHVRSEGPPVVVLVEVASRAAPPSPMLRRTIREDLMNPRRVAGVAFVHGGMGLRARMIRGVLGGIARTQAQVPTEVFEYEVDARRWLQQRLMQTDALAAPRSAC